jgi:ATP-dependent Clp protease adaptor protein ClpS
MTLTLDHQTATDDRVIEDADVDAFFDTEDLWAVIVWNDDVTTFQTVIQAFVEIFNHSLERADQLAWTIHRTGKAVAAIRPKDEAEAAVRDLHRRKISASLAPA